MKIRKATVEDVVRMAEIFVFNNRVNFYPIFKDINYSFRELNVLSVALEYKKDIYSYYVYEDEILKGFIKINGIEIEKLYVDTFFQNEGIGGSLIEYAKENLGSKELWALEKNVKGIRFYQRHGFVPDGEKKLEDGTSEYLVHLVLQAKKTVEITDFEVLDRISEEVFEVLMSHINEETRYSTSDLLKEARYDVDRINIEDLNRIDYNLNKLAKKNGIVLECEFAKGLFIGTTYLVPYKIIKNDTISSCE